MGLALGEDRHHAAAHQHRVARLKEERKAIAEALTTLRRQYLARDTAAEVVVLVFPDVRYARELDPTYGYHELVVRPR